MAKRDDSVIPAKLTYTPAEPVSLRSHPEYDEAWVERQINAKPAALGLGAVKIKRSQLSQKKGGRLDILAEDESNQFLFTIELMVGSLDSSHIIRAIDYWQREKARERRDGWETVTVIVAEDIRQTRFYNVVRFLSERMPLVVIEMHALQVGKHLTLTFNTLNDGRDQPDTTPLEQDTVEVNADYWAEKASPESVDIAKRLGAIIKKVDAHAAINWNQQFLGIRVGNRAVNFVIFVPKKQFVRVHARIPDTDGWTKKLNKAGFEVIGGTPGRSVHFRVTKQNVSGQKLLLQKLFSECYEARTGGDYEEEE